MSVATPTGTVFAADFDGAQYWPYSKIVWGSVSVQKVVDDASGSRLPVKVGDPLPAGTNAIGTVGLNAGTSTIGKVGVQVGGADVSASNFMPVQEASITNGADVTPSNSVTVTAGRQFAINCTVAGNVKVKFTGGYTLTFQVATGFTLLPWQVVQVFVTGTTATATYANLS